VKARSIGALDVLVAQIGSLRTFRSVTRSSDGRAGIDSLCNKGL
jgi:hypothetical protein